MVYVLVMCRLLNLVIKSAWTVQVCGVPLICLYPIYGEHTGKPMYTTNNQRWGTGGHVPSLASELMLLKMMPITHIHLNQTQALCCTILSIHHWSTNEETKLNDTLAQHKWIIMHWCQKHLFKNIINKLMQ